MNKEISIWLTRSDYVGYVENLRDLGEPACRAGLFFTIVESVRKP